MYFEAEKVLPPPIRLSYALIPAEVRKGSSEPPKLRISVMYASGSRKSFPGRFDTEQDVELYLTRFYPELIGKCTGRVVRTDHNSYSPLKPVTVRDT